MLAPVMLALLCGQTPAGPGPEVPLDARPVAWFDAGRPRTSRRIGPSAVPERTVVEVMELDRGRSYRAEIGPHALVTAREPPRWARLGVVAERAVLEGPVRVWKVRSAIAPEDGLALAARLHRAGVEAIPDLWIAHRPHDGRPAPDDPLLDSQWYARKVGLVAAWAIEDGEPSVTVVVNDNGCDLAHPDLMDKLDPGLDVIGNDADPSFLPNDPGNEHGTACAGLVGAETSNGLGIAGACPECRVRCVRLLAGNGALVSISDDVEAFQFARDSGAAVVSNSWGFAARMAAPMPLVTAIEALVDGGRGGLGAIVVFAAGNDNRALDDDELTGVRGVLTVGATNNFDEPTSFTNFGASVDLTAPTGSFTTDVTGDEGAGPGDYTSSFGGTSSAAPLVAGVAALLVSAKPSATGEEITRALMGTLQPAPFAVPDATGHDPKHGFGIVDPVRALRVFVPAPEPADAGVVVEDAGVADAAAMMARDAAAIAGDAAAVVAPTDPESCTNPGAALALHALVLFALRRRDRR